MIIAINSILLEPSSVGINATKMQAILPIAVNGTTATFRPALEEK